MIAGMGGTKDPAAFIQRLTALQCVWCVLDLVRAGFTTRVRLEIIRNARIKTVFKYESCMVSKVRMISKRTRIYM